MWPAQSHVPCNLDAKILLLCDDNADVPLMVFTTLQLSLGMVLIPPGQNSSGLFCSPPHFKVFFVVLICLYQVAGLSNFALVLKLKHAFLY
jgi:hypothetical protein